MARKSDIEEEFAYFMLYDGVTTIPSAINSSSKQAKALTAIIECFI